MGWVVNATPRQLYLQECPGTYCTGSWVGHRAGLDGYGKYRHQVDSIPGPSSLVASRYTYWAIPAHQPVADGKFNFVHMHCVMHRYGGWRGEGGVAPHILILGTGWTWFLDLPTSLFVFRDTAKGSDWVGEEVMAETVWGSKRKRKIRESHPDSSAVHSLV